MVAKKIVRKKKVSKKNKVKSHSGPNLNFELPTKTTEISDNISDYIIVLSGERKIGKTTFFQQLGGTFFVMLDRNKGLKLNSKRITSWDEFLRIVELLEANPNYCEMVIIDTGYTLYELCFKFVCREHGVTDPRDKGWGVVWKDIFRQFVEAHERILEAGFGLGVIAHSEEKELPGGGTKLRAKLSAGAYTYYTGLADVLAHYQYNQITGKRELIIKGTHAIDAGTNIDEHFKYTDGSPIEKIAMGSDKKESCKNFLKAFNNKLERKELKKKIRKKS